MARRTFGGTAADFLTDSRGNVESGGTGTVWTARTGGTQITDLLDANGAPVTTVSALASPEGMVLFSGPDDGTSVVWVDFGGGRVKMVASDAPAYASDLPTNVKDYGAVGDGVTDDTAAIQAALTASGSVYLPPGDYKVSATLTRSGALSLRGAGTRRSRLIFTSTATGNGITVTLGADSGIRQTCQVEDLAVLTQGYSAGSRGLSITDATPADRYTPSVILTNVAIGWLSSSSTSGWGVGVYMDGCQGAFLNNVYINGKVGSGGEPNYDSTAGVQYTNAVAANPHPTEFQIIGGSIKLVKDAITADDMEGLVVSQVQIVGVNRGVVAQATAAYPHVSVQNNHINASDGCILVSQMYEAMISGNLLYNQNSAATGAYGVTIAGAAKFFSITGNIYEVLNTSLSGNGVVVSSGSDGVIDSNVFRRCNSVDGAQAGTGVWLTSSASAVAVGESNIFSSEVSTSLLDQGASNRNQFAAPRPTYTVAGLPAATTAGLLVYVSDGRKNGEAAGAGTGVVAFSDGTAWRACDTGATVSA